jgi:RNA-directed DNA polymerase
VWPFDKVNHDILMDRVAKRESDKRLLKIIRAFLNAGVMEHGLVSPITEGAPQGGPLSPLLSNLLLDDLDQELARRGHRFCRYADDCNVYVRSRRAGERVMASICRFLTTKLRLEVNMSKSAVARTGERQFLGFRITSGTEPLRHISPKALRRFQRRVRELTRRTLGVSLPQLIAPLARYLTGWRAYYGFCQTPKVLQSLDAWIRRRLRMYIWRQWANGPNRFAQLRRRGIPHMRAAVAAGAASDMWAMSRHVTVQWALRNAYFDSIGLPRVAGATHA